MMKNKFIYSPTKSLFEKKLAAGEIGKGSVVFIKDTKEIWNRGYYFGMVDSGSGIDPEVLSGIETAIATLQSDKADKSELSDYALKSELPSLDGYLTKTVADSLYATIAQYNDLNQTVGDIQTELSNKLTSTDLEGYAKTADVPTKISDLTDDSDFITNAEATAAYAPKSLVETVSNQATTISTLATKNELSTGLAGKLDNSAADGFVPITRKVNGVVLNKDITITATDPNAATKEELNGVNTDLQTFKNNVALTYATDQDVADAVASLVDSSPEALDTLNELAAALGDDPNFATTVATNIGKKADQTALDTTNTNVANLTETVNSKVDKVSGKGLSTNDFTNNLKTKLDGIVEGANVNVQSDWNATSGDALILNKPTIPSVGNGTVTITQNGTTMGSFTMNQSGNATIALTDTTNSGTITEIQANGTSIATAGVANILSATTSRYGVTKLSSATNSTSTTLAATPNAVRLAYNKAVQGVDDAATALSVAESVGEFASGKWTWNATEVAAVKVDNAGYADSAGGVAWSNVSGKPTSLPADGGNANTIGGYGPSNFTKRYTYTIPINKSLRIEFGVQFNAIIYGRVTLGGGSLILIGNGYGENRIRNSWTQLSKGSISWSVPASDSYSKTIEIQGKTDHQVSIEVISNAAPTFTEIESLTSEVMDNPVALVSEIPTNTNQLTNGAGFITSYTDTKNTAGSTNSTSKLYLIGAGSQAASAQTYSNSSCYMQSGYLYATSDERLKNFENDITIDFNSLKSIPKKYFRWKENPENLNIGTSAQALQKVYPELVTTDENGEMGVNYQHLSIVALAAIDKLHEENLELKERIERLESKIK